VQVDLELIVASYSKEPATYLRLQLQIESSTGTSIWRGPGRSRMLEAWWRIQAAGGSSQGSRMAAGAAAGDERFEGAEDHARQLV
jgi:hypothetical protein